MCHYGYCWRIYRSYCKTVFQSFPMSLLSGSVLAFVGLIFKNLIENNVTNYNSASFKKKKIEKQRKKVKIHIFPKHPKIFFSQLKIINIHILKQISIKSIHLCLLRTRFSRKNPLFCLWLGLWRIIMYPCFINSEQLDSKTRMQILFKEIQTLLRHWQLYWLVHWAIMAPIGPTSFLTSCKILIVVLYDMPITSTTLCTLVWW